METNTGEINSLTRQQIEQLPELSKTMRAVEIAMKFGVKINSIYYFASVLRSMGHTVEFQQAKRGVKSRIKI